MKIDDGTVFESAGAFADAACQGDQSTFAWTSGESFAGSASMGEVVKLAHTGWSTHRQAFSDSLTTFTASHGAPVWSTAYDVTGAWVDVDRFLSGEPECMVQPVMTHDRPIVRIGYNMSIPGHVSTSDMIRSGGIVAGLVDVLTAGGNAVELVAYLSVRPLGSSERRGRTFVVVKRSDQALDIDAVAFAVAHPSMLRRLWFGWADQWPAEARRAYGIGHSYGASDRVAVDGPHGAPFDLCVESASNPDAVLAQCERFLESLRGDQ